MRIILFRTYKHLKLYYYMYIPFSKNFHLLINSSLYPPNFGNISSITVKIRQFQDFSWMYTLIANV